MNLILALAGGFLLSFLSLGLLWAGVPWPWQFLMAIPFGLIAWAAQRRGTGPLPVVGGAVPVGALLVQFRDAQGSHALPVLLVLGWAVAVAVGTWLARRRMPPGG